MHKGNRLGPRICLISSLRDLTYMTRSILSDIFTALLEISNEQRERDSELMLIEPFLSVCARSAFSHHLMLIIINSRIALIPTNLYSVKYSVVGTCT